MYMVIETDQKGNLKELPVSWTGKVKIGISEVHCCEPIAYPYGLKQSPQPEHLKGKHLELSVQLPQIQNRIPRSISGRMK